jgi:transposase-like protein
MATYEKVRDGDICPICNQGNIYSKVGDLRADKEIHLIKQVIYRCTNCSRTFMDTDKMKILSDKLIKISNSLLNQITDYNEFITEDEVTL